MVAGGRELIDTLWNVNKISSEIGRSRNGTELIDTLWNVNLYSKWLIIIARKELIDTLWNVNTEAALFVVVVVVGINRYIMECKSS